MTNPPKFQIAQVEDRLRFQSEEGWLEMKAENGRAMVMGGTFNATVPEVFGERLWHLLQAVMPDLGIKVCQVGFPTSNTWLERIFTSAGFSKDGTLRSWAPNFQDVAIYSILDSEVKYEAQDAPRYEASEALNGPTRDQQATAVDAALDSQHAGPSGGDEQGPVQRDGPDDGLRGAGPDLRGADEPDGAPIPATRPADAAAT